MSGELVCPNCDSTRLYVTLPGMRVARGVSINSGIESCRASIDCDDCNWYMCTWHKRGDD